MIKLKGGRVEATTDKKKEHCFVVESDGETHLFSADSDASVNEWVASVKDNLNKEPGEAGKGSKMVRGSRLPNLAFFTRANSIIII